MLIGGELEWRLHENDDLFPDQKESARKSIDALYRKVLLDIAEKDGVNSPRYIHAQQFGPKELIMYALHDLDPRTKDIVEPLFGTGSSNELVESFSEIRIRRGEDGVWQWPERRPADGKPYNEIFTNLVQCGEQIALAVVVPALEGPARQVGNDASLCKSDVFQATHTQALHEALPSALQHYRNALQARTILHWKTP